jgi:hypothetical protein
MQIVKTWVPAIRTPMAATFATIGGTATPSWNLAGSVATGRTADSEKKAVRGPLLLFADDPGRSQ